MKRSKIVLVLIVLATLASNTACSSQNKDDLVESSAVTSETMASTTIRQTSEPVIIVQETMPEIIATPTEAITELEKGIEYLRDLHSVRIAYSTYYLKMDQEVQLRDNQAADGILLEDLGTNMLRAGTVLTPLERSGELSKDLSADTVFVMIDGRCVTFDISTDEDGGLRVNGYPAEKVLGSATYPSYPDWFEKEEGKLRAMEAPEWGVTYKVLTITTDWNEDGVKDTFRRELDDDYEGSNGTLIFTDGATGESTDGQFMVAERSTELYWQGSWNMDPDSEYPNVYSCTLQEITAERMTGDAIDTITIPAGMVIFPLYTVVDESGAGVLYFRTVTDSNCQMSYVLEDNGWNPLFGGLEQRDLFWCAFGG